LRTHITRGACAYPITLSTNIAGGDQLAVVNGHARNVQEAPDLGLIAGRIAE